MMAPYYALRLALAWAVALAMALFLEGGLLLLHVIAWWRQAGRRGGYAARHSGRG